MIKTTVDNLHEFPASLIQRLSHDLKQFLEHRFSRTHHQTHGSVLQSLVDVEQFEEARLLLSELVSPPHLLLLLQQSHQPRPEQGQQQLLIHELARDRGIRAIKLVPASQVNLIGNGLQAVEI